MPEREIQPAASLLLTGAMAATRYVGGTASGATLLVPPEVDLEHEATDYVPPGRTASKAACWAAFSSQKKAVL